MVKLNERKIRWIIQQKLRGRGAGEIALIQHVTHKASRTDLASIQTDRRPSNTQDTRQA